jgi:hypothetical protein
VRQTASTALLILTGFKRTGRKYKKMQAVTYLGNTWSIGIIPSWLWIFKCVNSKIGP